MKILYIHPSLADHDGAGVFGTKLIREFDLICRQNPSIEVLVFPGRNAGQKPISLRKRIKNFLPVWMRKYYSHFRQQIARLVSPDLAEALKAYVDLHQPDVIYSRIYHTYIKMVERIPEWEIPFVLQVDAALFYEIPISGYGKFSDEDQRLERNIWASADAILVVSNGLKKILVGEGVDEQKIIVNPVGVDPIEFTPSISGEEIRRKHKLRNKKIIGFVGKLSKVHDLITLIDAFALTKKEYRGELALLIVGEGSEREAIQSRIEHWSLEKDVILTGFVPHTAIPSYIAAFDICASPLLEKNVIYCSPIKMYEYMAMAKPIVITRGGQIDEVLSDGHSALFVKPECNEDFSRALLKLLAEPDLGRKVGERAREIVCQDLTWRRNANVAIKVCQQVWNTNINP